MEELGGLGSLGVSGCFACRAGAAPARQGRLYDSVSARVIPNLKQYTLIKTIDI